MIPKPRPASEHHITPADLEQRDTADLPMVDARSSGSTRMLTLDTVDRGAHAGRVGIAVAVLGVMTPDEIESCLLPELWAMVRAARLEQVNSDARDDHAREVEELAKAHPIGDLRDAMHGTRGLLDVHDREVVAEALQVAETYAAAGIVLVGGRG